MRISVTARHMDMTDGLKQHAEQQVEKLTNHLDNILEIDIVLSVEKHRHMADVTLRSNGLRIHGRESTGDMYASIDAVVAKLDRQIRKHKSRIKKHKHREAPVAADYSHSFLAYDEPEEETEDSETEHIGHKVVRHEQLSMSPLSVADALFQLDITDDQFLVFTNEESQKVNVLYKHNDGTFGLIEPPF